MEAPRNRRLSLTSPHGAEPLELLAVPCDTPACSQACLAFSGHSRIVTTPATLGSTDRGMGRRRRGLPVLQGGQAAPCVLSVPAQKQSQVLLAARTWVRGCESISTSRQTEQPPNPPSWCPLPATPCDTHHVAGLPLLTLQHNKDTRIRSSTVTPWHIHTLAPTEPGAGRPCLPPPHNPSCHRSCSFVLSAQPTPLVPLVGPQEGQGEAPSMGIHSDSQGHPHIPSTPFLPRDCGSLWLPQCRAWTEPPSLQPPHASSLGPCNLLCCSSLQACSEPGTQNSPMLTSRSSRELPCPIGTSPSPHTQQRPPALRHTSLTPAPERDQALPTSHC